MSRDLAGRIYIVTGAGGGIGRATAMMAASRGASVLCVDLDALGLADTVALARDVADSSVFIVGEVLDVTDAAACAGVVGRVIEGNGGVVHALANVAGVIGASPLETATLSELERLMRVNVGGVLVMTQTVLPYLGVGAAIVNVSSSSAQHVSPGLGLYGASKAANLYLTRSWAAELAGRGIRVCGIAPGAVDTAMPRRILPPGEEGERILAEAVAGSQPINRMANAAEIATAIGYLLSDDAGFITGSTLWIDGGSTAAD